MNKPTLIPNWRDAWKWISVHSMVLAAAVQGAWLQIPEDMKAALPPHCVQYTTIVLLVVGVIGRFVKQGANHVEQPKD